MQQSESSLQPLGRVIGTHGLRGDLKIRSHPEDQSALLSASRLCLRPSTGETVCLEVRQSIPGKGCSVFRLHGLDQIGPAESLIGAEVLVDPKQLQREANQLFWFELEGLEVVDRGRGSIGRLEGMFRTAAHAIYVVQGPFGEVLIPVVDEFVSEVNLERRELLVDVPDGLFAEQQR